MLLPNLAARPQTKDTMNKSLTKEDIAQQLASEMSATYGTWDAYEMLGLASLVQKMVDLETEELKNRLKSMQKDLESWSSSFK